MDTENGVPPKRRKNFRKNSEQKIIVDNNQRETLYETALETPMVDLKMKKYLNNSNTLQHRTSQVCMWHSTRPERQGVAITITQY